jgi:glycerophosphoryl diester phosphodiesterase
MKRTDLGRPWIFAHRGACRVAPENTLPAFEAAVALGADGVELDVQYSSDGQLLVFHNPSLEATTNGTGRFTSHTAEELRALDAGSFFAPEFAGTQIPTLDEVLDLLNGRLLVNIEIKALDQTTAAIGADVVKSVRARDMQDQVVISSFNPMALRRAKKFGPEIESALLLAPDLPGWLRSNLVRRFSRADGVHPETPMVDEAYMAWARKERLPVRVWTVNDEDEMRRLAALAVDAIITDAPDVLAHVLGQRSLHLTAETQSPQRY